MKSRLRETSFSRLTRNKIFPPFRVCRPPDTTTSHTAPKVDGAAGPYYIDVAADPNPQGNAQALVTARFFWG